MTEHSPEPRRDAPSLEELPAGQRARRERIVSAAVELLATDPFSSIHMRQVAERAEVALGTLYRYFPSKDRLFAAALNQWASTFQQRYESSIRTAEHDPEVRLARILRAAVRGFERSPHFFDLLVQLQSSDDPEVEQQYARYTGTIHSVVRDALAGVEERLLDPIETLVWGALFNLLRGWSTGDLTMPEVQRRLDACLEVIFVQPAIETDG